MKTRIKRVLTRMVSVGGAALITLFLIAAPASGFSGSGAGTVANPYQITNCAELQEMKNNLTAHYVLMNDIDCSDTVNWNSGAGFEPIGPDYDNPFIGSFIGSFNNGQGHIITGLYINRPSTYWVGLFGIADGAEIKNVGLEDVDISGRGHAGGLVGVTVGGDITASYVTGRVVGSECGVAGLVSVNIGGTIENCYAKVNVSSHDWSVGGLVSYNIGGGIIKNCYATGTATDDLFVGGLVGHTPSGTIENSYATGNVTGYSYVGGLVGLNSVWPSLGSGYATIINCYYNNHAGNPSVGIGFGPGDCTAIGNNESYFYYSSNPPMDVWDFVNIWGIDEGVNYPYLLWQIPHNHPPIANAGADQGVHPGTIAVTLDGSASSDPDEDPLTYSWEITSKPAESEAELFDATTPNPTFIPDLMGDYTIELVVTDSLGAQSEPDSVLVSTYNAPPVADAGPDQAVIEIGTIVQLDGIQSWDEEGDIPLAYLWTITGKPAESLAELDDLCSPTPTFVADIHGDYVISLVVTDIFGAVSEPDEVVVSFENVKPVADAGDGQAVIVGETVPLDGSGSYDDNLDELTYSWSFVSKPEGSVAVLSGPTSVQTSFVADWPGTYVVSLVVNDGFVDSEPDNVTIEVISTQDAVVETIFELIDQVNLLPAESLKNRNMKKPLINKINAVLNKIDRGFYDEALDKLQNDILQKTNGCADIGEPDRNDWITTCEAQGQVYPLIIEAIELLENLI